MKKPCKHIWHYNGFAGDPFCFGWSSCKVNEICRSCQKERSRAATGKDCEEEIKKLTCQSCGFPLKEHSSGGCIMLMADMIRDLQERMRLAEREDSDYDY